ncbi:hypothetical protein Ahy_B10g104058 [Arachis hypogaea]|uniref:Aminotransferase-like plant mobile domain-containing protein n=1 Tax=Arachis hypogaea TaxID=3818 RepID=A0A444X4M5_ARAHY|nr:hypothetical protein Ahy_B10g104058 [Arachis hypogaea]
MVDEGCLYRLNGVAYIAGGINKENMPLHDRIIPYLERAGLYHLARLNTRWFWMDEPLLGLPMDENAISGYLTDFHLHIEGGKPAWEWFQELFSELPSPEKVKQYTVHFTWFHEKFRVLSADASEETLLLGFSCIGIAIPMHVSGDQQKCDQLGWSPTFATVMDLLVVPDTKAAWTTYLLMSDGKEQRMIQYRLALDRLGGRDIVWEPYTSLDVFAVVHPEILTKENSRLWRAVTSLVYFAVIEWHQVDRVFPQPGSIQHVPDATLNIYYLHSPSAEYLDWWYRVAHRILSPDKAFGNPRPVEISEDAVHRGSSQAPVKVPVLDMPNNRHLEWRRRIGTWTTDWEWRQLDDMMHEEHGGGDDGGQANHHMHRSSARCRGARSRY